MLSRHKSRDTKDGLTLCTTFTDVMIKAPWRSLISPEEVFLLDESCASHDRKSSNDESSITGIRRLPSFLNHLKYAQFYIVHTYFQFFRDVNLLNSVGKSHEIWRIQNVDKKGKWAFIKHDPPTRKITTLDRELPPLRSWSGECF